MKWSLPSGNSLPKLFKAGQSEIWHLKARRSGALQRENKRRRESFWKMGEKFTISSVDHRDDEENKDQNMSGVKGSWLPWSGLCLPPVVKGKSSHLSFNDHVRWHGGRLPASNGSCITLKANFLSLSVSAPCCIVTSVDLLNADAPSWAGALHVFNVIVTFNKKF